MRVFNRVLAALLSLTLIVLALVGIIYLVARLVGSVQTQLEIERLYFSLVVLPTSTVTAILAGIFLVSLVLLILELRPQPSPFIQLRAGAEGSTNLAKRDLENVINRNLGQYRDIAPLGVQLAPIENKFRVRTVVRVPEWANQSGIRERVRRTIKERIDRLGLQSDFEGTELKVVTQRRPARG